MTRKHSFKISGGRATWPRAISALLLVFLIYTTTVEAAHQHGRIFNSRATSSTCIANANVDVTTSGLSRCSECLICQLHQSFSTTLITAKTNGVPLCVHSESFAIASPLFYSQTGEPQGGRAPPLSSL